MIDELVNWSLEQISSIQIRDNITGWSGVTHNFCERQVAAIQAAGLTGRPLLVRGDPGLGKSQLAPALASKLGFDYNTITIHADTEIKDLLYRVDHVERLFLAQSSEKNELEDQALDISNFLHPGILWQAIAPGEGLHNNGLVVLIDEIDKAESSLPNALLEVLNNYTITVPALKQTIQGEPDRAVFFVLTSNDERELPAAFLRRCAVLDLSLNDSSQLVEIFNCHKERLQAQDISDEQVQALANELVNYRKQQKEARQYAPGTAEFLDILSALAKFSLPQREAKLEGLRQVFMYKKDQRD